jgi:hypothetical protein
MSNEEQNGFFAKPLLPDVLFQAEDDFNALQLITENSDFFIVKVNPRHIWLTKFKKFKIGKTGILWGYWGEKYRDAIAGRFFNGEKKYEFEVISDSELKVVKNGW